MNYTERRFCGIPTSQTEDTVEMCINEAVGSLTFEYEDGEVSVPVCNDCLEGLTGRVDKPDQDMVE